MIAPDTSVLIAGFDPQHPFFDRAEEELLAVRRSGRLVAHTLAETFAVLSAAAGPYGATGAEVLAYLDDLVREAPVGIPASAMPKALRDLASAGVSGGAVYDGLIAVAAGRAGAELVSLDARAARTYARAGTRFRLLIDE